MAGKVYYIPGDDPPAKDLVVEASRGRVEMGVGGASETPADTTALILGPQVDPSPALERVEALTFVQLTTCENPFIDALDLDKRSVRIASIAPSVADEVSLHTLGLAVAAVGLPSGAGPRTPGEIASLAGDVSALSGLQVGIIGLGNVGTSLARRLGKSGAKLVYADLRTAPRQYTTGLGIRRATLDLLLTKSDVIVMAARWGPTANPLIGTRELRLPDPGAVIVNAADSRLVDESALHAALSTGHLKGAGLGTEVSDHLASLPNVVTSSLGLSAQSLEPGAELVVSNLERLANEEPAAGLIEPTDYPPAGDPSFWSSRLYPHRAG